jgi:hypothetical protein
MIAAIGDHQVIEDSARIICEQRIALAAWKQTQQILWHQALESLCDSFQIARASAQQDLTHMRNIEKAGGRASMQMFFHDAGEEVDRHLVTCKWHKAGAQFGV